MTLHDEEKGAVLMAVFDDVFVRTNALAVSIVVVNVDTSR
jgi:hypothetical protein